MYGTRTLMILHPRRMLFDAHIQDHHAASMQLNPLRRRKYAEMNAFDNWYRMNA